jgi:hypothetical protein
MVIKHYASQNEWPVLDDLNQAKKQKKLSKIDWSKLKIRRRSLLSTVLVSHDQSHSHSLLRHDKDKVAKAILEILD